MAVRSGYLMAVPGPVPVRCKAQRNLQLGTGDVCGGSYAWLRRLRRQTGEGGDDRSSSPRDKRRRAKTALVTRAAGSAPRLKERYAPVKGGWELANPTLHRREERVHPPSAPGLLLWEGRRKRDQRSEDRWAAAFPLADVSLHWLLLARSSRPWWVWVSARYRSTGKGGAVPCGLVVTAIGPAYAGRFSGGSSARRYSPSGVRRMRPVRVRSSSRA